MLDEKEFAEIEELYRKAQAQARELDATPGVGLNRALIDLLFAPVRLRYEVLTGARQQDHTAILHHRIALYGPPCRRCHKPLRTPQAKLCGSCMTPVDPA